MGNSIVATCSIVESIGMSWGCYATFSCAENESMAVFTLHFRVYYTRRVGDPFESIAVFTLHSRVFLYPVAQSQQHHECCIYFAF